MCVHRCGYVCVLACVCVVLWLAQPGSDAPVTSRMGELSCQEKLVGGRGEEDFSKGRG